MLDEKLGRLRQVFEAAGANRELPVGPGIADRDQCKGHGLRAAPGCRFRHHRDPDTRGDQPADRIETPQPRPNPKAHAEPGCVLGDMGGERRRARQPDKVTISHLDEIDLAAAQKFSAPGRDQHQAIFAKGKSFEMLRQGVFGDKAEIGRPRRQWRRRRRCSRVLPRRG